MEEVLSSLQVDLLLPYPQLLLSRSPDLPGSCLSFALRSGPTRWYLFSEGEELRRTRAELTVLMQVREQRRLFPLLHS